MEETTKYTNDTKGGQAIGFFTGKRRNLRGWICHQQRQQDFGLRDLGKLNLKQVSIERDQVGELAHADGAGSVLLEVDMFVERSVSLQRVRGDIRILESPYS